MIFVALLTVAKEWNIPSINGYNIVSNVAPNEQNSRDLLNFILQSPRQENLQYSCLENPMDRGAWWATLHRVAKRVGHDLATKQ